MGSLFKSGKQTSTSEQSFNNTSTTSGERTKRQSNLFKEILDQLMASISQGPNVMESDRQKMRAQTNQTYNAIAPRLESQLTSRGFGNSGKLGAGFKGIDIARANEIQSGEATLRDQAMQRYLQELGIALPYTRPDTVTTTSSGTGTGSQTVPGPSIFDKLLGYAGDAAGIAAAFGF